MILTEIFLNLVDIPKIVINEINYNSPDVIPEDQIGLNYTITQIKLLISPVGSLKMKIILL